MSQPTAIVVGVGAPKGLGAALCRRTAKEGLHTWVAGRTRDRIEAVADERVDERWLLEFAPGCPTLFQRRPSNIR